MQWIHFVAPTLNAPNTPNTQQIKSKHTYIATIYHPRTVSKPGKTNEEYK
jgi:hypothetical protein